MEEKPQILIVGDGVFHSRKDAPKHSFRKSNGYMSKEGKHYYKRQLQGNSTTAQFKNKINK